MLAVVLFLREVAQVRRVRGLVLQIEKERVIELTWYQINNNEAARLRTIGAAIARESSLTVGGVTPLLSYLVNLLE